MSLLGDAINESLYDLAHIMSFLTTRAGRINVLRLILQKLPSKPFISSGLMITLMQNRRMSLKV
jgi:hypothetical protein